MVLSFGRRPVPRFLPTQDNILTAAVAPASVAAELPSGARYQALREIMLRIFAETAQVADAMKANGTIALRGIVDDIDPTTAPIELKDLKEQFTYIEDGVKVHPFFGYAPPGRASEIDPTAQFHLYELVLRVRCLNVFCQEANRDEALGVALQVPRLPKLVDQILASAAFFAAYFENLGVTNLHLGRLASSTQLPDLQGLKQTLERHKLMATDRMVHPDTIGALLPKQDWPHIGVEILRPHESEASLVHGVYFPAEYARNLAEKSREPRSDDLRLPL